MLNVKHYAKTGITGGTDNDMDSIDVTAASFAVGSVCRVYQLAAGVRSVLFYKAEESSATADGDAVVIPVVPAGYSGDIRWHKYSVPIITEIKVVSAEPDAGDMESGVLYLVVE